MEALGINEALVREQVLLFERSDHFIRLHRPCTPGDGIHRLTREEATAYRRLQEETAGEGRFQKFVPASGAASRMFQDLFLCQREYPGSLMEELRARAQAGDPVARACLPFLEGIRDFAFFEDLGQLLAQEGQELEDWLAAGRHLELLPYLLMEPGLNYGTLPKWQMKFHRYLNGSRTALEEHLVEAVPYVRDRVRVCRVHFTLSPEHQEAFEQLLAKLAPCYEQDYQTRFKVGFSVQHPATCTIAVDLANRPFREPDGSLIFRPGGHGALLHNLNELEGDLVYIKNIDNVVVDHLKVPTVTWKKILGGYLVNLETRVHQYVRQLEGAPDRDLLEEILAFTGDALGLAVPENWRAWPARLKRDFLWGQLNRPLRVCGMVPNEGEPGGGPFWVAGRDGSLSRQIVESAQVDPESPDQQAIWAAATHFNPVDLVCAVRDYRGVPFNLHHFVDPQAVFISRKSKNGEELQALEWAGLWNGAMAHWITLFVEVPALTFNPVKTILDLLRPPHQP
jgi:hypothetical protein